MIGLTESFPLIKKYKVIIPTKCRYFFMYHLPLIN
nr:MAG TPA: hypothetical protein [Caudoviricetes sp.]